VCKKRQFHPISIKILMGRRKTDRHSHELTYPQHITQPDDSEGFGLTSLASKHMLRTSNASTNEETKPLIYEYRPSARTPPKHAPVCKLCPRHRLNDTNTDFAGRAKLQVPPLIFERDVDREGCFASRISGRMSRDDEVRVHPRWRAMSTEL
jgi:hypothetical protein